MQLQPDTQPPAEILLPLAPPGGRTRILATVAGWYTPGEAFGLPSGVVRAIIALAVVWGSIYVWWSDRSDRTWQMPQELQGLLAAVWGYYLGQPDASSTMKAVLILSVALSFVAFELSYSWAPPLMAGFAIQGAMQYFAQRKATSNVTP